MELTTLAMLRWVKTSPGLKPRTVVSGTRESEQPIHRMGGAWPLADSEKKFCSFFAVSSAHCLLLCRHAAKASPAMRCQP